MVKDGEPVTQKIVSGASGILGFLYFKWRLFAKKDIKKGIL